MKYSIKEKKIIAFEAMGIRNKSSVSIKYGIHISTLYAWIDKYYNKTGRIHCLSIRLSAKEKSSLQQNCEDLGYGKDVSTYVRRLILGNYIPNGNPRLIIKELYANRAELNKIGSNFNQLANYTNFLHTRNYLDNDYEEDFKIFADELNQRLFEMREVLDKTIRKINR